jgi:O-antigen ligase
LLNLIKPIVYLYVFVTLTIVFTIPGAIDPVFGDWRGLTAHKNNLGQFGVILTVLSLMIYQNQKDNVKKYLALVFILLSIVITLGTYSSTSYTALFIFLLLSLIIYLIKGIFENTGVSNFLSIVLVLSSISVFAIVFYLYPQITDSIQGIFGKSETFYDRGKLWQTMLWRISEHPILGCGFQGFWVITSHKVQLIYNTFLWLPIQAHNGYLDIINEVGIVGFLLFVIIVIRFIIISVRDKKLDLWTWLVILPLIINITESTFFRSGQITFIFFMISYLSRFSSSEDSEYSSSSEYKYNKDYSESRY